MNPQLRKYTYSLLRYVLGAVFLFSGAVKSFDTVGTAIYVEKYFAAFGFGSFDMLATPVAVLLGAAELTLGLLLLFNILTVVTSTIAVVLLTVFTVITLLNATVLPIGDCGCFGDALYLSPMATLLKNIVMLPMALWLYRRCSWSRVPRAVQWVMATAVFALSLLLNIYVLRHLPIIDFMPYGEGVNLREEYMTERERMANSTHNELRFVDKYSGEEYRFSADDAECWLRDDLQFVDAVTVQGGADELRFGDFAIYDSEGRDVAQELLMYDGCQIWLVISVASFGDKIKNAIDALYEKYDNCRVVVLTSAEYSDIKDVIESEWYHVDAMTLRSMIRADVGVLILDNGRIESKYNICDM